jgi:hypothetical protein
MIDRIEQEERPAHLQLPGMTPASAGMRHGPVSMRRTHRLTGSPLARTITLAVIAPTRTVVPTRAGEAIRRGSECVHSQPRRCSCGGLRRSVLFSWRLLPGSS